MSREWTIYVRDMVACCDHILMYTEGVSRETFDQRGMVFDATVRNLELLGEAARQLPEDVRARAPAIEWRKLIDLRNVLIHGYFGIDVEILWDLVQKVAPVPGLSRRQGDQRQACHGARTDSDPAGGDG